MSSLSNPRKGDFWSAYLAGLEHRPTPFQASRRLTGDMDACQEARRLDIGSQVSERLQKLVRQNMADWISLAISSWAVLVHYYSGSNEICFGWADGFLPHGNRNTRVYPIRLRIDPTWTLEGLVARVRELYVQLMSHAPPPAGLVREQTGIPITEWLYDTTIVTLTSMHEFDSVWMLPHQMDSRAVACVSRTDSKTVGIRVMGTSSDASIVHQMPDHFERILRQFAFSPGRRVAEVTVLDDAEVHRIVDLFNDTRVEFPQASCVHQVFENQARRTPDNIAVVCQDRVLTYRDLDAKANQLARRLRDLGVVPETVVGVALERSPELIIAFLATLKAGGAYLPLDPAYPIEQLLFMVSDAEMAILLSETGCCPRLCLDHPARLDLDSEWDGIALESTEPVDCMSSPQNLAYVMYTSGTTGKPKGVQITHRGIVRLLSAADYMSLGTDETFLLMAPATFDASTLEIWAPLLHGAKLIIAPPGLPNLSSLGRLLKGNGVTTLWLTASLFNKIIDIKADILAGLRQLLVGGEALSVKHIARALDLLPETRLINGYGPTESTVFTCCFTIPAKLPGAVRSIPVGKPISNTQVYIVDPHMRPMPIGVTGELVIGGEGLARGYLRRPSTTAEKFVPNPFDYQPGSRLYRTGDLAKYLQDGSIEFVGRVDHQVKVKGFRIELAEIEIALQSHPSVREAVALLREIRPGEVGIVCYLVLDEGTCIQVSEIQSYLRTRLPHFMLPEAYLTLSEFPLGPSGKTDRKALGAMGIPLRREGSPTSKSFPPDSTEYRLARVWREVLELDEIDLDANFFDLGGNSLDVIEATERLAGILGREMREQLLLEYPTIRLLARHLDEAGGLSR